MKSKIISFTKILSVVILFSAASFFAGSQMQEKKVLAQNQISKDESTTIAVVNQDSGITYNDKEVNYALDVVNSLDNDFVLTNRESAKKGLEDGKYGGILILPGNFSKNVISVNDVTPSKVEIYYETNKNLSSNNKLIVSGKISDFEKKLNNKLSYMYVSSMFKELHQGQDYISVVLNNDNVDLDAINAISDSDILSSIDITKLEDKDIKLNDLDLTEDFNNSKKIIDKIDKEYTARLAAKDDDLSEIKNEVLKLTGNSDSGLGTFREQIKNMTPEQLKEALTKKHQYDYSDLSTDYNKNVDDVNEYIENLTKDEGEIDTLIKNYNNKILSDVNSKGIKALDKCETKLEAIDNLAKTNKDNIKNNVINKLKDLTVEVSSSAKNDSKKESLNQEYLLYSQIVEELKNTNPNEFESIYNNVMSRNNVDYTKILKTPTNQVLKDNNFASGSDFKTFISSPTTQQGSQAFAVNRSDKYRTSELTANESENIQKVNEIINNLENVQNDLYDMQMSADVVRTDSNYKYLNTLFNKDSNLLKQLQLDKEFIDPMKEKIENNNKNKLIKTIKSNNKTMVDDVKLKVQNEVEEVVSDEGPLDINGILKMFDEKYTQKFDDLLGKINETVSTPSTINEDQEKIDSLWDMYDNNNNNMKKAINDKINEDKDYIEQVYDNADEHINTMQDNLEQGIETSQDKISEALENAKATKKETSSVNAEKLQSLSTVLSNSRVGTVENTDVYNFISNPVSAVQTENLAANIKNLNKSDNFIKYSLGISIMTVEVIMGLLLIKYQKKKNS